MPSDTKIDTYRLIVCSPGDVAAERTVVRKVVDEFNRQTARERGYQVDPWFWETDAHPGFHPKGSQGQIDQLMRIDESDVVVGIFWWRFGTPTPEANSGTEHELRKAFAAWKIEREPRRPQCMVYFKDAPYSPKNKAETAQWGAVLQFRDDFPAEGLWWKFPGTADFETLFRDHLHGVFRSLLQSRQASATPVAAVAAVESPQFSDSMARDALLASVHSAANEAPLLVIGGMAGAGKTYLASEFARDRKQRRGAAPVFWHDTADGESVDCLLAELEQPLQLKAASIPARCKELVAGLRQQGGLLVIDNFQSADQASYQPLIAHVLKQPPGALVVLTTQRHLPSIQASGAFRHIGLLGFNDAEARRYLQQRGLKPLPLPLLRKLIESTDGLPLAMSLYCTLVKEFALAPEDVLSLGLTREASIADWYRRMNEHLDAPAATLLRLLSVIQTPFNTKLAHVVGEIETVENVEDVLRVLAGVYLLQRPTPDRWKTHELVASLSRSLLIDDVRSRIHHAVALHFQRGYPLRARGAILADEEFIEKSKALDHLLKSGRHAAEAESLFLDLAATAKRRSNYTFLINAAQALQEQGGGTDPWVDYHRAHAYLVLGAPRRCAQTVQRMKPNLAQRDASLKLGLARLHADALLALGNPETARSRLDAALADASAGQVGHIGMAQALSTMVAIEIAEGRIQEAISASKQLLVQATTTGNELGAAVALARLGTAHMKDGRLAVAIDYLEQSIARFTACREHRGKAWATTMLVECLVALGEAAKARQSFASVVAIYTDTAECGADYRAFLQRLLAADDAPLKAMAQQERERVDDWSPGIADLDS